MATYNTFTDLDCWKKCRIVRLWVGDLIKNDIPPKDYDMIQNIKRAGRSTTRNIAEGFGRRHTKENIQYLRISKGSLTEIQDDIITCLDDGYIDKRKLKEGFKVIEDELKSVNGFIKYLKQVKNIG